MAFEDEQLTEEEAARRHRWRRIRTSVTLLILVGVVIGAAWYSWANVVGEDETSASSTGEPCALGVPTSAPAPADVQVNVYNSTDRNGLASAIAREVRGRGFTVVDVDNDPLDRTIAGTAEVRSRPADQAAAELVATMVPGAVYVPDERTEATIDLVLGEAFEALSDPAAPPPTPAAGLEPCAPVAQ